MFLIPGIDETLRLNGSVSGSTDNDLLAHFSNEKVRPKSVTKLEVNEMFLHCSKAFARSKFWNAASIVERSLFPPLETMIDEQLELGELYWKSKLKIIYALDDPE